MEHYPLPDLSLEGGGLSLYERIQVLSGSCMTGLIWFPMDLSKTCRGRFHICQRPLIDPRYAV